MIFEEYLTENWICPKCGEVKRLQVEQTTKRDFEKNSIDMFEFSRTLFSNLKVYCSDCGSECYIE